MHDASQMKPELCLGMARAATVKRLLNEPKLFEVTRMLWVLILLMSRELARHQLNRSSR